MNTNKNITHPHGPLKQPAIKHAEEESKLFSKENYKWMLIGLVVMAIGFFLMAGGKIFSMIARFIASGGSRLPRFLSWRAC
jgi:hypothetical protein